MCDVPTIIFNDWVILTEDCLIYHHNEHTKMMIRIQRWLVGGQSHQLSGTQFMPADDCCQVTGPLHFQVLSSQYHRDFRPHKNYYNLGMGLALARNMFSTRRQITRLRTRTHGLPRANMFYIWVRICSDKVWAAKM